MRPYSPRTAAGTGRWTSWRYYYYYYFLTLGNQDPDGGLKSKYFADSTIQYGLEL